jgi:hypothetical protein
MTPHQEPSTELAVVAGGAYDCVTQKDRMARCITVTSIVGGTRLEFVSDAGNTVNITTAYQGLQIVAWIQSVTANTNVTQYVLEFE